MIIRDKDSRNQSSEQRWKIGSSGIVLSFLMVQRSPEKGRANIPKTKIIQKYIEEIILLRRYQQVLRRPKSTSHGFT
jgi:hypothetical protein